MRFVAFMSLYFKVCYINNFIAYYLVVEAVTESILRLHFTKRIYYLSVVIEISELPPSPLPVFVINQLAVKTVELGGLHEFKI